MKANKTQEYSIILWIFIAIGILIFCSSCEQKISKRAFRLAGSEDDNWSTTSIIYCDSVQMVNPNQCYYYIDGHKFNFYSKMIKLYTN
jgi:hypothetical protein